MPETNKEKATTPAEKPEVKPTAKPTAKNPMDEKQYCHLITMVRRGTFTDRKGRVWRGGSKPKHVPAIYKGALSERQIHTDLNQEAYLEKNDDIRWMVDNNEMTISTIDKQKGEKFEQPNIEVE